MSPNTHRALLHAVVAVSMLEITKCTSGTLSELDESWDTKEAARSLACCVRQGCMCHFFKLPDKWLCPICGVTQKNNSVASAE